MLQYTTDRGFFLGIMPTKVPEENFLDLPLDFLFILCILYMYSTNGGIHVELIIRNSADRPIYDQIYTQIKALIIAGKLRPGEALPSIRALAKDLRISVITTKRAYDELEADGFLYTVAGKGCFVAEMDLGLVREQHLKELEEHLSAAAELAHSIGISPQELQEMLRILLEEGPSQ